MEIHAVSMDLCVERGVQSMQVVSREQRQLSSSTRSYAWEAKRKGSVGSSPSTHGSWQGGSRGVDVAAGRRRDQWRVKAGPESGFGETSGEEERGGGGGGGGGGTAELDWRTFRAKLVAGRQAVQSIGGAAASQEADAGLEIWQNRMSLENWALLASQNPRLAKEVPWAHPIGGPEEGGILIAAPDLIKTRRLDERYWQTVIFLLKHSPEGSWGLILNRPSGYSIQQALSQVNQADASLSVFARSAIYVGGFRSDGKSMFVLHGNKLKGAEEVIPGVFMGGLESAAEEVLMGSVSPLDFRFFVGRVEWQAGTLEREVEQKLWIPAACARSLILKQCLQLPKPLWREVLELMGGDYAEAARKEYGESA